MPPASTGTSRLDSGVARHDSGVARHDSASAAGGQGAERPDSPAPHVRLGLGHPVDPLFNPADLGEGLGPLHLLCLVVQIRVHRACSLTGECLYPQLMAKACAATLDESRIRAPFARPAAAKRWLRAARGHWPSGACIRWISGGAFGACGDAELD